MLEGVNAALFSLEYMLMARRPVNRQVGHGIFALSFQF